VIGEREITSQEEFVEILARRGYNVTQTTVSRDLAAIGAEKAGGAAASHYTVPGPGSNGSPRDQALARILREFVLDIEHSRNLVVLKTAAGAANPVAAAIDRNPPNGVLGTIAGDDTVLVIARDPEGGSDVARRLTHSLES
jgi:transcriptional regulator of arginine metabolism